MTSRVLTITVGSDLTKISDVSLSAQKIVTVHSVITINTPSDAVDDGLIKDVPLLAQEIKKALAEANIVGKNVVFTIQSSRIANKEVVIPALKPNKIKEFLNANATEYFPVTIEDYILSYSILEAVVEDGVKKNRAMVAIAPADIIDSYYALAERLAVRVESIDYSSNSTLQIMKLQIEAKDDKPSVVIQIAEDTTVVTIIKNNVMQLMRSVPYGKSTVATALMEKREITYEEAVTAMADTHNVLKSSFGEGDYVTDSLKYLVNNISRIIDFYKSKNGVEKIEHAYVLTEGAPIYGIDSLFEYELNVEQVSRIDSLKSVVAVMGSKINNNDLTLYLANIGAVIQPVGFLPKSIIDKVKKESTNKYFGLIVLLAILAAAILVTFPLTQYLSKKQTKTDLGIKVNSLKYVEEIVNTYYKSLDKYKDVANYDEMAYSNNDYLNDFIDYLEKKMPSDISISSMSITNGSVTMSFSGSSKQSVALFIIALKEKENISNVYVPSLTESIDAYGVITVNSSLTCEFVKPSEPETTEQETESTAETTVVEEGK